jgi:hypothetical protein
VISAVRVGRYRVPAARYEALGALITLIAGAATYKLLARKGGDGGWLNRDI